MPRYFTDDLLRRLRNEIPWKQLLVHLGWPHKMREAQLAFLYPHCHEYRSAVNPRTNLGRYFRRDTNFNPIEITMAVRDGDFMAAVRELIPMLPTGKGGSTSR